MLQLGQSRQGLLNDKQFVHTFSLEAVLKRSSTDWLCMLRISRENGCRHDRRQSCHFSVCGDWLIFPASAKLHKLYEFLVLLIDP